MLGELWLQRVWSDGQISSLLSLGRLDKSVYDNWIWHAIDSKYNRLKFVSDDAEVFIQDRNRYGI